MMKAKGLIASCLALGFYAGVATVSTEAASRNTTRKNHVAESQDVGKLVDNGSDSRTHVVSADSRVFDSITAGPAGFYPQQNQSDEEAFDSIVADDMGLAPGGRQLTSYIAQVHQRTSEGDPGYTAYLSLRYDNDGEPGDLIPGTDCSADSPGVAPGNSFFNAKCDFGKDQDSGIVVPDNFWMAVTLVGGCNVRPEQPEGCSFGGDDADEDPTDDIGPGWLTTQGISIGTSDDTAAVTADGGSTWSLFQFSNGPGNFMAEIRSNEQAAIPTVSEWGMVAIVLLVLTGGTIVLRRSRRTAIA